MSIFFSLQVNGWSYKKPKFILSEVTQTPQNKCVYLLLYMDILSFPYMYYNPYNHGVYILNKGLGRWENPPRKKDNWRAHSGNGKSLKIVFLDSQESVWKLKHSSFKPFSWLFQLFILVSKPGNNSWLFYMEPLHNLVNAHNSSLPIIPHCPSAEPYFMKKTVSCYNSNFFMECHGINFINPFYI